MPRPISCDGPAAAELYDLEAIPAKLAAQAPWWEPGTRSGYHAVTQGNLEGEILHRITGRRIGQWFADDSHRPNRGRD